MENSKATLPDMIQSRVDDLVNGQTVDEEMAAHMKELDCRVGDLVALAQEGAEEQARQLGEDIEQLCARLRKDFVAIAYKQGLVDGAHFKQIMAEGDA
jgi:hypothetical protein